jgi:hypothetical protein
MTTKARATQRNRLGTNCEDSRSVGRSGGGQAVVVLSLPLLELDKDNRRNQSHMAG